MARARKHKDVEFMVEGPEGSGASAATPEFPDAYYDTADEASSIAIARSMSRGGEPVQINVLVMSKAGAKWYGGYYAVEVYEEDPDASVHEQIIVRAESVGRIP